MGLQGRPPAGTPPSWSSGGAALPHPTPRGRSRAETHPPLTRSAVQRPQHQHPTQHGPHGTSGGPHVRPAALRLVPATLRAIPAHFGRSRRHFGRSRHTSGGPGGTSGGPGTLRVVPAALRVVPAALRAIPAHFGRSRHTSGGPGRTSARPGGFKGSPPHSAALLPGPSEPRWRCAASRPPSPLGAPRTHPAAPPRCGFPLRL